MSTYPVGGIPAEAIDIPAAAVLLVVYLGLGIVHAIFFFKLSQKTFIPQAMLMGFCFSRVLVMCLRLAWTTNLKNKNVAITANVFLNAGVLLIYIVNLIFLHHFILHLFPSIPIHIKHPFNLIVHLYMFSIIPLLVLVVVPGVQLFLSTNLSEISRDHTILRFAQCYMIVYASVQVIAVIFVWVLYLLKSKKTSGLLNSEVTIRASVILVVGVLLTWIQTVKILQAFYTPTPQTAIDPPWFLRRPTLYSGFFLPELLCIIIYAVTNIRLRFLKPVRDTKMDHDDNEDVERSEEKATAHEADVNHHEKFENV